MKGRRKGKEKESWRSSGSRRGGEGERRAGFEKIEGLEDGDEKGKLKGKGREKEGEGKGR